MDQLTKLRKSGDGQAGVFGLDTTAIWLLVHEGDSEEVRHRVDVEKASDHITYRRYPVPG